MGSPQVLWPWLISWEFPTFRPQSGLPKGEQVPLRTQQSGQETKSCLHLPSHTERWDLSSCWVALSRSEQRKELDMYKILMRHFPSRPTYPKLDVQGLWRSWVGPAQPGNVPGALRRPGCAKPQPTGLMSGTQPWDAHSHPHPAALPVRPSSYSRNQARSRTIRCLPLGLGLANGHFLRLSNEETNRHIPRRLTASLPVSDSLAAGGKFTSLVN